MINIKLKQQDVRAKVKAQAEQRAQAARDSGVTFERYAAMAGDASSYASVTVLAGFRPK